RQAGLSRGRGATDRPGDRGVDAPRVGSAAECPRRRPGDVYAAVVGRRPAATAGGSLAITVSGPLLPRGERGGRYCEELPMKTLVRGAAWLAVACVFLVVALAAPEQPLPEMKFNDVREIAPGVFFRYSSISATDPSVPFGGSNNIWVVFKDHVVVIDANFPKEAGDVIAAIKKTTDKPIAYGLDTHHHADHAYGNCISAQHAAKIV